MLGEPLAILYLRDPDRPHETRTQPLKCLYGLTPSQARLADRLATGLTLSEAAGQLGITTASARQYLKVIFQKTGTGSQAQLVRKVLMVPPAPNCSGRPARDDPASLPAASGASPPGDGQPADERH